MKPLEHHSTMELRALRGPLSWAPNMPRDTSLSDSCTPDRCTFSILVLNDPIISPPKPLQFHVLQGAGIQAPDAFVAIIVTDNTRKQTLINDDSKISTGI